jgi:hypothetical protein
LKNKFQKKVASFFSAIIIFMIVFGGLINLQISNTPTANAAEPTTFNPTGLSSLPSSAGPIDNTKAIEVRAIDPSKAGKTPQQVNTEGGTILGCGIGDIANGSCLLVGILKFNGMLLGASAALFGVVVDAKKLQDVVASPALYTVWMEVRDFLNIAFILFLLYSAFSIIFQIGGKFGEKKIILTIVLMALLVNFSFPIARFIVDISNSLMYTMLTQFFPNSATDPTSILTGITTGGDIKNILQTNTDASYPQLFAAIFFTFLLAVTFLALAVLFLVRIVALAILIIISPVAFVGNIAGKDFGWWDNIIKYSFFGPIMVFVLHIAIFTMTAIGESFELAQQDSVITSMANMAIPIVILWMGMGIAQKMGIEGASTVMGAAQKASTWLPRMMGGGVKSGAKYAAIAGLKAFERNVIPKGLRPRGIISGWKKQSAESERKALEESTGIWHDRWNSAFSLGKDKTRNQQAAIQTNVLKKQKELSEFASESEILVDEFTKAKVAKDTEKMSAVLRIMFNNNDQNEFMKLNNQDVDPFAMKNYILKQFTEGGMNEQEALRQMADLGEIANSKGNFANYAMASWNVKKQKYQKNEDPDQAAAAIGKANNIKVQTKADTWHWNSFLTEIPNRDTNGNLTDGSRAGGLHAIGLAQLRNVSQQEVDVLSRVRPDFIKNLASDANLANMETYATGPDVTPEQSANITAFINKLRERRGIAGIAAAATATAASGAPAGGGGTP